MKKLKLLILTIFIVIISVKGFANTTISYTGNVSAEFPNADSYSRFTSSLTNTLNKMFINNNAMITSMIINYPNIILDEVDNFYFGGSPSISILKIPEAQEIGKINSYSVYPLSNIENNANYGVFNASFSFGTSLYKNLDIFLVSGLHFPIMITFLWKFFENKDKSLINSKLFLIPTVGFTFDKSKFSYFEIGGYYKFDDGIIKIPYDNIHYDVFEVIEKNNFMFLLDVTLKYNLSIKWFNFHISGGIALNFYSIKEKYLLKNVNIDYTSFGSPTGVNTDIIITHEKKGVDVIPHLTIGISFKLAKWITFPMLMFNTVYVPSAKKFIIGGTVLGLCLFF